MNNPQRYPAQVFYSDDDQGFIAVAPDLPGCSAFGETQEEAVVQLRDAIEAWQLAAQNAGNPIPEPSKPQSDDLPSGKILLRLPRSLHALLVERAKRENVSLNQHLVFVLTASTSTTLVRDALIEHAWNIRQYFTPSFGANQISYSGVGNLVMVHSTGQESEATSWHKFAGSYPTNKLVEYIVRPETAHG